MKRFAMTVVFICGISLSTLAGDVPTVGISSTTPGDETPPTTMSSSGEIPSVGLVEQEIGTLTSDLIKLVVGSMF